MRLVYIILIMCRHFGLKRALINNLLTNYAQNVDNYGKL